jgi:hypothetical protein
MAKATSYRSKQRFDDGHEVLPVLGGVPQQSGTDQDAVRAKLSELLSVDWDFSDPQGERLRCPRQGTFHVSDKLCLEWATGVVDVGFPLTEISESGSVICDI